MVTDVATPAPSVVSGDRERLPVELTAAQVTPLTEAGVLRYRAEDAATTRVEYEWDHVLVAALTDGAPGPDASEVREVRWAGPGPLQAEIAAQPDEFTPWLAGVLDIASEISQEGTRP